MNGCRAWLHERRPSVAIGRFLSARLHRRIFMWFGATILLTALAAFATIGALDRVGSSGWRSEHASAQSFVGQEFQRVWGDPVARDALARVIAEDFDTDLELLDARGRRIARYGQPCRAQGLISPIRGEGGTLGTVRLCPGRRRSGGSLRLALPLLAVAVVLWAASGLISRRLARPLVDLARVAHEIGAGKLSSRVRLDVRKQDEVGVVAEAVNDMAARIERQLADQRELLAAVSHELRTPLARIRLLTEMARTSTAPSAAVLDDLDREVMEIDALVGDLLASSRLDFAALTVSRLVPAEAAIRALERAGLDPTLLEVAEWTPTFEADATLLARALANLLENARAHAGGAERLRVRPGGPDRIVFEVEDRGPGFADGEETRIFEPFFRRDRAQGSGGAERGSLGLGLALCKRIAEAHGGRAFAERREGGGARVGIELALRPPDPGARPARV
ncbi:histidine kinase [Sorangium cellulosum]|uniref:histidine kinase n=1 Tax=Sorangium cellulosum TaxID=56 RepID=A0A2L0EP55_SORCE|nr:HAMP domain-containing sensor histidine kinase [Sorangium cellulosum]AUX41078.1 histidine kinase [Sorangium cellulosum]